jgi:hypothetical protein
MQAMAAVDRQRALSAMCKEILSFIEDTPK